MRLRRTAPAVLGLAGLVLGLIAVALAGLAAARPAAGSGTPLTLAAYTARLDAARVLATDYAPTPSPQAMTQVRAIVGLPLDVTLGGTTVHIPGDAELDRLSGRTSTDFDEASDQLSALEDTARAAAAAPTASQASINRALASSLRGITTQESLLTRLRQDIVGWILRQIGRFAAHVLLPSDTLLILGAALLVAIVWLVMRHGTFVRERAPERQVGARKAQPVDWDRLAEEALARGDLAGAVRARYGGILAALAHRGLLTESSAVTAGECRQAVATGLPAAYPLVSRATSIFEATLYGRSPVERAEVETMTEALAQVGKA